MDSTEFNKIAGAAIGALLVFLLLNFFSGQIYGTREAGEHHGEEVLAFALAVETEGAAEAGEEPQVDYLTLVAAADPAAGENIFRACSACHKVEEGANAVGPHLFDVVGRDIASVEGFGYSDALAAAEGDWTLEHLSGFLENPKAWAPGTKMSFAGLDDPQDRVNVIAYLNEVGGTPVDLADGLEPLAAAADAGTAIPDPALSPGVGPGPGVNPPGEAVEGAPAQGESAGIEAMSEAAAVEGSAQAVQGGAAGPAPGGVVGAEPGAAETSVSEGDNAGGVVTGTTIVDNTAEGADVPTSPAAETHEGERRGEDILQTGDPSREAPAQQAPGTAGLPGTEAPPLAGSPEAVDAEEDAAVPGQTPPAQRVEGEDAPPQAPPGQAPERGAAATGVNPVVPEREGVEVETTPMELTEEADAPPAQALPEALEPGETRAAPRAEPPLEVQPEQTPPGQAPAAGPGGPAGVAPLGEAVPGSEAQETEQLAAAPAAPAATGIPGDAAAGEKIFRRCAACHKLEEGKHGIGPSLWGVVGRDVAAVEAYNYSDAMAAHEGAWTFEQLSAYLENPKAVVPGTKMAFAGLKDEQDRIDVITYLNEADGTPEPLQ